MKRSLVGDVEQYRPRTGHKDAPRTDRRARPLEPGVLLWVEDDRGRHTEVARGGLHPRVAEEDCNERRHQKACRREVGAVWHPPRLALRPTSCLSSWR